jgi:plasmid stability protein
MGTDQKPDRAKIAADAREVLESGLVSHEAAREGLSLIAKDLRSKFSFPEDEPCPILQLIRELDAKV